MAGQEEGSDFYAVLGLEKDCSSSELRFAYKKLALRWHPDRCSASGNANFVEEAKKNFQAIQEAYSVLSDENKRLLYDAGVYDNDDDDENGMGDFLGELMTMMRKTKPSENGQQSFEDLQNLFQDMVQKDTEFFNSVSQSSFFNNTPSDTFSCSPDNDSLMSNKKNCSSMSSENTKVDFNMESLYFSNFCVGVEGSRAPNSNSRGRGTSRRTGRKQKTSSHDAKILA